MRLLLTVGILFVGAATGALAQSAVNSPTPAPAASDSASPAPSASPAAVVHIREFKYVPASVTVHPGDTVTFIQDDDSAHTVTATDGSYDSGDLPKGKSWSHTYAAAGTSNYLCTYHRFMTGSVTVK